MATRCHTADLAITNDGGLGAAGAFFGLMVVRNTRGRTCTVYGYPGLQRRDANGQPIPPSVQRTTPAPVSFSLEPQQQATSGYTTRDQALGNLVCTNATAVEVTSTDETTHVNVKSASTSATLGEPSLSARSVHGKLTAAQYLSL